jgi:hypothetical protein
VERNSGPGQYGTLAVTSLTITSWTLNVERWARGLRLQCGSALRDL